MMRLASENILVWQGNFQNKHHVIDWVCTFIAEPFTWRNATPWSGQRTGPSLPRIAPTQELNRPGSIQQSTPPFVLLPQWESSLDLPFLESISNTDIKSKFHSSLINSFPCQEISTSSIVVWKNLLLAFRTNSCSCYWQSLECIVHLLFGSVNLEPVELSCCCLKGVREWHYCTNTI